MSLPPPQPAQPPPTAPHNDHNDQTSSLSSDPADSPTPPPAPAANVPAPASVPAISPSHSLADLRRRASELAALRSTDRRDERRQTAMELAAAMPECRSCRHKAKLGCANQRCHTCCTATHAPCAAHHTADQRQRSTAAAAAASPAGDPEAMQDALAADDAIGTVVTGVVDEVVQYGYRVRLLVNGFVCEGLLFDDAYEVTVSALPADMTAKELQRLTIDALPPLPTSDRPLFPEPSSSPAAPAASPPKPKVRHLEGYPKGPRSGYVYYTATMRAQRQTASSDEERLAVKADWSALSDRERAPYVRWALLDKDRWMREMADWKRRTEESEGREESQESTASVAAVDNNL